MRELNLIPDHIKQKREIQDTLVKAGAIGLLVVVLLAVVAVVPYAKLKKLDAKELALKASIENAKPVITENAKLKKETASYKEHIAMIEKIQKSNVSVFPIFKNLEKYMPKDVIITSLSFNEDSINISASAKDYNSINEFAANLQESKEFISSSVSSIARDEKTGENTFTLIITNVKGEVK
jgi:Tfp pilus assembly protein PilN